MDTAWKVSQIAEKMGYPVVCVGVPKTVDNDLPLTDCCPGFGSVAKYVATSIREAGYDVASMSQARRPRSFVLEVMGRHAGWITAACGLASENVGEPPHILLFPEVPFNPEKFLGSCSGMRRRSMVIAPLRFRKGLSDAEGKLIADSGTKDAFRAFAVGWRRTNRRAVDQGSSWDTNTTGRWLITCSVRRVTWHLVPMWNRRMRLELLRSTSL
jgi:hypothetical protein